MDMSFESILEVALQQGIWAALYSDIKGIIGHKENPAGMVPLGLSSNSELMCSHFLDYKDMNGFLMTCV